MESQFNCNMKKSLTRTLFCIITAVILGFCNTALSQQPAIQKIIRDDGKAHVLKISNSSDKPVTVILMNDGDVQNHPLEPKQTKSVDVICSEIRYSSSEGIARLWRMRPKPATPSDNDSHQATETEKTTPIDKKDEPAKSKKIEITSIEDAIPIIPVSSKGWRDKETIITDFRHFIENTEPRYYSDLSINEELKLIEGLNEAADKEAYIQDNDLKIIYHNSQRMLEVNKAYKDSLVVQFLGQYKVKPSEELYIKDNLKSILDEKLMLREANLKMMESSLAPLLNGEQSKKWNWPLIGLCAWLSLMAAALIWWFLKAKKKSSQNSKAPAYSGVSAQEASSAIVVRRKTTSILRKQSLENVIDNPAYKKLDSSEFCQQSAVRRIYIKNTCIKDIYNMYAEDLRNPENPKEDGCMVLGRWVYDKDSNEYYVSLEHVVLPGDDAVFAEYELNFGGKIKLKVTEKLRKLRRETDLQYDLTCWVHSHPGLGVFFSNSDSNVQMQLKHPNHPNFLTAIVVDILTPQQEFGIFTFKPDGTINSKSELTRMYSLEEMYKWAVESERNSFKPEDHYNTLATAKSCHDKCHGIHLSNGAIIDLGMLAIEGTESGLAGMVHGFSHQQGNHTEIIATSVSKEISAPDSELVGCFITAKYCSIPTVRKAITEHVGKIKFVLVYSASDGMLTSIPVINNDLCTDVNYYGEQKLEDLKIWTRRRR